MTRYLISLLIFVASLTSLIPCASGASTRVFVLPIEDEIDTFTWQYVRSGLEEMRRIGADMLVVRLNTYGGAVDAADSIRTALLRCDVPTVGYIDNNAASAGALIALACDSVYMRPDATMGAATVVDGADGTAMPDKYQSYMRAMMRATAESHGRMCPDSTVTDSAAWRRSPLIAEAMVDQRISVPGLVDSTKVLTFTATEAMKWGYADGLASGIPDMLGQLGVSDYDITTFEHAWLDTVIGWLNHPALKALLISFIVLGIYIELQAPGSGLPAAASLTAAVLYFLPAFVGGSLSPWIVLLFAVGVILLIFEILVIPGFGVAGIAGSGAVAVSLFWGLLESYDSIGTGVTAEMVWKSVGWFLAAVALVALVAVWLASEHCPRWVRKHTELDRTLDTGQGYVGVDMSAARHIGREAVAVTDLRPGGKVSVDGERLDAVSVDGYIEQGTRVEVVRHQGAQLYVRISH